MPPVCHLSSCHPVIFLQSSTSLHPVLNPYSSFLPPFYHLSVTTPQSNFIISSSHLPLPFLPSQPLSPLLLTTIFCFPVPTWFVTLPYTRWSPSVTKQQAVSVTNRLLQLADTHAQLRSLLHFPELSVAHCWVFNSLFVCLCIVMYVSLCLSVCLDCRSVSCPFTHTLSVCTHVAL